MEALKIFAATFLIIVAAALIGLVLAWPTQWLWNSILVEAIDGVNKISFWQAYGILLLSSILFKSHSSNSSNK